MRIDDPRQDQLPQLRRLWKEAFGDDDAFLDLFFDHVFAADRCRCITVDGQIAAALYWLDCRFDGRPIAYLYAIATGKQHRGQGLCRALMSNVHDLFRQLGYAGAILVPGEPALFQMYGRMGYRICSAIGEMRCKAGEYPIQLQAIDSAQYARLRREMLPEGGVVQEGENLVFLEQLARFYAGQDLLLCAYGENGRLVVPELLGDPGAAPGILAALGAAEGTFRFPGDNRSFAMYYPLSDAPAPQYFGLAFD